MGTGRKTKWEKKKTEKKNGAHPTQWLRISPTSAESETLINSQRKAKRKCLIVCRCHPSLWRALKVSRPLSAAMHKQSGPLIGHCDFAAAASRSLWLISTLHLETRRVWAHKQALSFGRTAGGEGAGEAGEGWRWGGDQILFSPLWEVGEKVITLGLLEDWVWTGGGRWAQKVYLISEGESPQLLQLERRFPCVTFRQQRTVFGRWGLWLPSVPSEGEIRQRGCSRWELDEIEGRTSWPVASVIKTNGPDKSLSLRIFPCSSRPPTWHTWLR